MTIVKRTRIGYLGQLFLLLVAGVSIGGLAQTHHGTWRLDAEVALRLVERDDSPEAACAGLRLRDILACLQVGGR